MIGWFDTELVRQERPAWFDAALTEAEQTGASGSLSAAIGEVPLVATGTVQSQTVTVQVEVRRMDTRSRGVRMTRAVRR